MELSKKEGLPSSGKTMETLGAPMPNGGSTLHLPTIGGDQGDYLTELENTKSQLLVFAREISSVYHREKKQAQRLGNLMEELHNTYLDVVRTLAFIVEAKDEYTRYHLERCREYGMALTELVDASLVQTEVEYGFLLHDVGKIGIPESILSKPGPLSDEEIRVMRTHPLLGVQIVAPMRFLDHYAVDVIRHHHERIDGTGYPDGLKGSDIPLVARVFSVVDAFDAMTTDRPYRRAMSFDEALSRLRDGSGTQFDPDVLASFEQLMEASPRQASA